MYKTLSSGLLVLLCAAAPQPQPQPDEMMIGAANKKLQRESFAVHLRLMGGEQGLFGGQERGAIKM